MSKNLLLVGAIGCAFALIGLFAGVVVTGTFALISVGTVVQLVGTGTPTGSSSGRSGAPPATPSPSARATETPPGAIATPTAGRRGPAATGASGPRLAEATRAATAPTDRAATATIAVWATAGSPSADLDSDTLDGFVAATVAELDNYWQKVFRQLGKRYTPPRFVQAAYNQRVRSKCGSSRGADHAYCPSEMTVYVDYDSDASDSFESLWDRNQDLVIVATLGHEWGHHVQNQLDLFANDSGNAADSRKFELQADCLMGVFIRDYARTAGWVEGSDLRDVIRDTRESGDDPDAPAEERDHGTSQQRVEAFRKGYHGAGPAACEIG